MQHYGNGAMNVLQFEFSMGFCLFFSMAQEMAYRRSRLKCSTRDPQDLRL